MVKLTKRVVDAAKGPKRRPGETKQALRKRWSWIGDNGPDSIGGFGLKVYGSGRKVFALRYRTEKGRHRMLTLGTEGEMTAEAARKLAREKKREVRDGEDPQANRKRQHLGIETVGELVTEWLEGKAKVKRKRWKEDEYRIQRHILPALGKLRLEDVTSDGLERWHADIAANTPVEANRAMETIRAAWRWAKKKKTLLPDGLGDPTEEYKREGEHSRERWLQKTEVARLMAAVNAEDDPHVRAAFPLLLLTGLRKGELLGARWSYIDLSRGEIRLPTTKSDKPQTRLLPDPAVEILRNLPTLRESPFVFPSPSDPQKPRRDLKRQWERIREAAGLTDVTIHDLRRTAGSHMAQSGVPIQVIQEVLGHSHEGVTRVYARLASRNERDALNTLANVLAGPMGLAKEEALPDQLRTLLDATENDPEALAAGLRALGLGDAVKA